MSLVFDEKKVKRLLKALCKAVTELGEVIIILETAIKEVEEGNGS